MYLRQTTWISIRQFVISENETAKNRSRTTYQCLRNMGVVLVTHKHFYIHLYIYTVHTVEPAHVVTSIKQSPVLKGHTFLVLS